ncbi:MAG: hypothetical protein HPY90_04535 [Syntrophothermus sp.]|uniref:hypothetical protein n=1 Tax=Syntrophothermus sp. TaxID=2736299 RepID=UPI00257D9E7B|nr:hypothetical protein [Syntrophothermus sp.]NSW82534.1 hypothetical protein [Syntrophothermus sp.]
MISNRALIAKAAITSADLATGGKLNPEQANKLIDYMVDQSAFLKDIRTERMTGPTKDLDFIGVANRIIRKGVEATEPTETAGIQTSKKQLNSTEIILPADISLTFLEDNIEREGAEDHIARMLALQFANDLTDLAWNGDIATPNTDPFYAFLSIDDGFIKLAKASANTYKFDTNGSTDYKGVVFPGMLNMLPNKWKANKAELRFYVSPTVAEAYIEQLTTRQTAWADELLQTGKLPQYKGITIFPVDYIPDDVIVLTLRKNLATGIQREFTSDRERKPRKRVIEYTMTGRVDAAQIVVDDALVIGYNIV